MAKGEGGREGGSGAGAAGYAGLRREFPAARWIFRTAAADYGAAIAVGAGEARYGWVFLLNSDTALQEAALVEVVVALRRDDVFAIGSRIRMEDGTVSGIAVTAVGAAQTGLRALLPGGCRVGGAGLAAWISMCFWPGVGGGTRIGCCFLCGI